MSNKIYETGVDFQAEILRDATAKAHIAVSALTEGELRFQAATLKLAVDECGHAVRAMGRVLPHLDGDLERSATGIFRRLSRFERRLIVARQLANIDRDIALTKAARAKSELRP